jgi:hypothetical protein
MNQDKGDKGVEQKRTASYRQRWDEAQLTKTAAFWVWVGAAALTMIVGFGWGGWVTGGTAQAMAENMAQDAVVKRLGPMCVTQFQQAPGKVQNLKDLEKTESWQRSEYIEKQGWATMPGETKPDSKVAAECERLLLVKK